MMFPRLNYKFAYKALHKWLSLRSTNNKMRRLVSQYTSSVQHLPYLANEPKINYVHVGEASL